VGEDADALLRRLLPFIDRVRDIGVQVIFTRYVTPPGERISAPRMRTVKGIVQAHRGVAAELVPCVQPRPPDIVLDKPRQSAFFRTNLDDILRERGIDTLLIAGVTTNVCCLATAQDAAARDYDVVVLEDLTAASPLSTRGTRIPASVVKEVSLAMVAHVLGEVRSSHDVLQRLQGDGGR
jgi:nicotinamidase-related amidase